MMKKQADAAPEVVDMETRLTGKHHRDLRVWLRLLATATLIEDDIRTRLRDTFDITLPRFDLLAQLERHPEGLRMRELSQRMMVTGGNITGITDQLEEEGLVVRTNHPGDRRSYHVKLTPRGRTVFARMATAHEGWVAELLGCLNETESQAFSQTLQKLKTHAATRIAAVPSRTPVKVAVRTPAAAARTGTR